MSNSEFSKCHIIHAIRSWTKIIVINTKINSVDKVVLSLIGCRLIFTPYLCPFTPFLGCGGQ